jgi:hypothetical protein
MFYKKTTIKTIDSSRIIPFEDTLTSDDQKIEFARIYEEYVKSSISYVVNYGYDESITVELVWANKSIYEEALVRCKSKQLELFDKTFQQYYEDVDTFVLDIETIDDFKQK